MAKEYVWFSLDSTNPNETNEISPESQELADFVFNNGDIFQNLLLNMNINQIKYILKNANLTDGNIEVIAISINGIPWNKSFLPKILELHEYIKTKLPDLMDNQKYSKIITNFEKLYKEMGCQMKDETSSADNLISYALHEKPEDNMPYLGAGTDGIDPEIIQNNT